MPPLQWPHLKPKGRMTCQQAKLLLVLSSDHLQSGPIPAEALATRHRASDTLWALRPPSFLSQLSLEPFAFRLASGNDLQGADCKQANFRK